jgi:hypothetical protein
MHPATMRATFDRAFAVLALALSGSAAASQGTPAGAPGPYAPVGLFFGAIEDGERIFTPTRLLPFDHPEAGGHQFPTVIQLHGTEFPLLVWLGARAGYQLWPTLERYPTEPANDWPYRGFRAPPDTSKLAVARVTEHNAANSPLPGLRAVLFDRGALVAFIVDTRGLTLAERGMSRATAMGLDLTRADLLERVQRAAPPDASQGYDVVLYALRASSGAPQPKRERPAALGSRGRKSARAMRGP